MNQLSNLLHSWFILFLILGAAAISNAVSAGDSPFGICAHIPDQALQEELKLADIHWIRCDFNWYIAEPAKGQWNWSVFDNMMANANAKGLLVFPTIGYAPSWANGGKEPQYPPLDPADWVNFVTTIVNRYKIDIKYWGMWNEPNLDGFFAGTM